MEQFTDLSFEYVKSVFKIYILLESKERHCSVTMAFLLNYLDLIVIFNIFDLIWNLEPFFYIYYYTIPIKEYKKRCIIIVHFYYKSSFFLFHSLFFKDS